ncbi:MAG: nitrogen regulatory protein P-II [Saprospiraceae bacterium]|nr:MAG: nitrogen regulatory protein P-II [Saprospiraceae bacterium]
MKKIEAVIRLSRFDAVRDALAEIGVRFFTLKEVKGFGLQKGETLTYRGSVYDSSYIGRLQLDLLTTNEKLDLIVKTIVKAGRTGEIGDGKITVFDVHEVTRIRTAETGAAAI